MATVIHPLSAAEVDAIRGVLWNVEHLRVDVAVGETALYLSPRGRQLSTTEKVTVLRAFVGGTDMPVRWAPEVPR